MEGEWIIGCLKRKKPLSPESIEYSYGMYMVMDNHSQWAWEESFRCLRSSMICSPLSISSDISKLVLLGNHLEHISLKKSLFSILNVFLPLSLLVDTA